MTLYGAIEAGGTKFNCAVMTEAGITLTEARIATADPHSTLQAVVRFFLDAQQQHGHIHALGMAAFGPIDVRRDSPTFGCLQATPKAGWSGFNLLLPLRNHLHCPMALDTDVNAAALAEWKYLAEQNPATDIRSLMYVTVGTGIGGGVVMNGHTVQGRLHPEMGHLLVRRHPRDQQFKGTCPFHGDCLEGLASGPAVSARWGTSLDQLPADHEAYEILGFYLGQLAVTAILMLSVERILFGGGVMQCTELLPPVRRATEQLLNGYLPAGNTTDNIGHHDPLIQLPALQGKSGMMGAWLLAQHAAGQLNPQPNDKPII